MSGGGSLGDLSGGGGGPSSGGFGAGDTSGGGGGFGNPMGDFGGTGGAGDTSSSPFGAGDPTGSGFGDSGIAGQSFGGGGSTNPAVDVGTQNDPSVVAPAAMNQGTAPNTSPGAGSQSNVPLPRDRPASAPPRQPPPQSDLSKIADLLLGKPQALGGIATSNPMGDQGGTGGAQQAEDIPSSLANIANPPLPQARPAGAPQAPQGPEQPGGPGAAIDQAQQAQVSVPESPQPQQTAQAPGAASANTDPNASVTPDQGPQIPDQGPEQPTAPATPDQGPQQPDVAAPASAPANQQSAPAQGQPGQGGQQGGQMGGQQGPQMAMKMVGAIVDLLTKGPMAFMQDLMGLAGQAGGMGGHGGPLGGLLGALGGGQGQGGMGGNPPPGTPMAPASWGTPPKGPQDPRWGINPATGQPTGQSATQGSAPVSPQSPSDPGKNNDPNEAGITENERQNRQRRRDAGMTGGDTYDAQGNLVSDPGGAQPRSAADAAIAPQPLPAGYNRPPGSVPTGPLTPGRGPGQIAFARNGSIGRPSQPSVDRSAFRNQLNEQNIRKLAWMINGEVGRNAPLQAKIVQGETAFNRAQMRGQGIDNALRARMNPRHDDGGYYDGISRHGTYAADNAPNAQDLEIVRSQVLPAILGGSNLSDVGHGPMTGNASAGVALNQFRRGSFGYKMNGGDTYFLEGPVRRLPTAGGNQQASAAPARFSDAPPGSAAATPTPPTQGAGKFDTTGWRRSENVIDKTPEAPVRNFTDRFNQSDAAYGNPDGIPVVDPDDKGAVDLRDAMYGKPTAASKRPKGMTPAQRRRLLQRQQDYETAP